MLFLWMVSPHGGDPTLFFSYSGSGDSFCLQLIHKGFWITQWADWVKCSLDGNWASPMLYFWGFILVTSRLHLCFFSAGFIGPKAAKNESWVGGLQWDAVWENPVLLNFVLSAGPALWRVRLDVCSTEKDIFMPKNPLMKIFKGTSKLRKLSC